VDIEMAEEEEKKEELEKAEKPTQSNVEEEESSAAPVKKQNLFERLFANGNKLITVAGSDIALSNETRRLVALFSDGTYLVSKDNRFDGAVYNFEANVKRRKIPIKAPTFVTLNEISALYAYAERGAGTVDVSAEEAEDMQMMIDFINIIQRASQKKVSDIHIIVGSSSS
jgi:type II secretory ATPase GspE/PulE/Tfp pilus assembly ATPase PilB-like protein